MYKRFVIVLLTLLVASLAGLSVGAQEGAAITITSPTPDQVLDGSGVFSVTGTGTALFENGLVVQARDGAGNVMAQQPVTTDAPEVGGTGNWQADFNITGIPAGTHGSIYAFAESPADGRIVAEATVNVMYGSVAPAQPLVDITTPSEEVVLPIGSPFTSTGVGLNLYNNRLVVQALSANGDIFAEQAVTTDGAGNWSVSLTVTAAYGGQPGVLYAFSQNAGGTTVAFDRINVVYGTAETGPQIIIVNPQPGQVLNTAQPVRVSGSSRELLNGNITIVAYDNNNNILAQQATTASSEVSTEGAGGWQVDLNLQTVPRGTAGRISAYSNNAEGRVAASASVNVIYGQAQPSPFLLIISPVNNAIVYTDRPIRVNGVGSNLLENRIFVRALDAGGNILAESMTRATAPDSTGTSGWQVDLPVNVAAGSRGTIYAFITRSLDGTLEAETRINVTYGGPCVLRTDWPTYTVVRGDTLFGIASRTGSTVAELTLANCLSDSNLLFVGQIIRVPRNPSIPPVGSPAIAIATPQAGAVLDVTTPVFVSGSASGLLQGNVTVRAIDLNGVVLAQQSAQVNAPNIGGQGNWQASLLVSVAPGTQGSIYVYSTAPSDGSVVADAIVDVTFGQSSEASIEILSPEAGAAIDTTNTVGITGTARGLPAGELLVRVLDNDSNLLYESSATVDVNGNWQLNLPPIAASGIRGIIYAYALSPVDGSIVASAGANVILGQAGITGPFVTISDPLPYATLDIENPIVVSGRGGGLFEGNVVVRAVDNEGNILAEEPTTATASEVGGEGDWTVELEINVKPGTRGTIFAFTTSAQDGSIIASATTKVIFGDASENQRFVAISVPLPDSALNVADGIIITGRAGGVFENTIIVQIRDAADNVLVSQPTQVNITDESGVGVWQTVLGVTDLEAGTPLTIYVFAASPSDGSVIASDSVAITQQ